MTTCPEDPVELECKLYKDGEEIAKVKKDETSLELAWYDPDACYNIFCKTDDDSEESMPFIKFSGHPNGVHDAWQEPYWLAGNEDGCMELAYSCEGMDLTIESWRNPSPDAADVSEYMCASKKITCSNKCPPVLCEDKDDKYAMYRLKDDGECEDKCVEEDDFIKKVDEGYDFCPCESLPPRDFPPQNCVLKRAAQLFKFEEWPERDDVYIQIWVLGTDRIYDFTRLDKSLPEFAFEDMDVFMDLKNAQDASGIAFQFVSDNGPGGWNTCKYSPIALDLDGSGEVESITGAFLIDITGDGEIEQLDEWFAPTEGILVHSFPEDGDVTGVHLLGDQGLDYADGFEKLADSDTDGNDMVEGDELADFHIWIDANSNTEVDDGELFELSEFGIVGLPTLHDNLVAYAALEDGGEMKMVDLYFTR